jgi:molecular chaperone GrpE (heat shock protein)
MKKTVQILWENIEDHYFSGMYPFKSDPFGELSTSVKKYVRDIASLRRDISREKENSQEKQEKLILCLIQLLDEFRALLDTHKSETKKRKNTHGLFDLYFGIFEKIIHEIADHGIHQIHVTENKFNPSKHQIDSVIDLPEFQEGHIYKVVKPGFTFEERILRKPQVMIVKHQRKK